MRLVVPFQEPTHFGTVIHLLGSQHGVSKLVGIFGAASDQPFVHSPAAPHLLAARVEQILQLGRSHVRQVNLTAETVHIERPTVSRPQHVANLVGKIVAFLLRLVDYVLHIKSLFLDVLNNQLFLSQRSPPRIQTSLSSVLGRTIKVGDLIFQTGDLIQGVVTSVIKRAIQALFSHERRLIVFGSRQVVVLLNKITPLNQLAALKPAIAHTPVVHHRLDSIPILVGAKPHTRIQRIIKNVSDLLRNAGSKRFATRCHGSRVPNRIASKHSGVSVYSLFWKADTQDALTLNRIGKQRRCVKVHVIRCGRQRTFLHKFVHDRFPNVVT